MTEVRVRELEQDLQDATKARRLYQRDNDVLESQLHALQRERVRTLLLIFFLAVTDLSKDNARFVSVLIDADADIYYVCSHPGSGR